MATYPNTIKAPTDFAGTEERARIKTETGGYINQRPQHSAFKERWVLTYNYLNDTDKDTLETFFKENQTLAFDIYHPRTGVLKQNMQFDMDKIEFKLRPRMNAYSTTVTMREV